jgi:hypothetical protein
MSLSFRQLIAQLEGIDKQSRHYPFPEKVTLYRTCIGFIVRRTLAALNGTARLS